jgi:iron-sulfur cluster assembly accessory protein
MEITVTIEALKILREVKERDTQYIRMGILPGGCSGFQYTLHLEDAIDEDDELIDISNDIKVVVDPFSFQYLDGVILDYQSSMMGQGFVFNNPNASGGCGCGSSFTV